MIDLRFLDETRRNHGLMTLEEIKELAQRGNVVFDPFSLLISHSVSIGSGNVFFPNVSLMADNHATLSIKDDNRFHPLTVIEAQSGPIMIGTGNQFGEGGFTARTNRPHAVIHIGDHGRYLGGASVFGQCELGSGSQILGAITSQDCTLEAGLSFKDDDVDQRAGLLKGAGLARSLTVPKGFVISAQGDFSIADLKPQSFYHPKSKG
jgi:hypothetical protein